MVKSARYLLLPALASVAPAVAQERAAEVNIAGGSVGEAAQKLSLQARVSIGFSDQSLAKQIVRPVRGRFTPAEALARMLAGTSIRARRVAPATYVIERIALVKSDPKLEARYIASRKAPPRVKPSEYDDSEIVVVATKRDVPLRYYPGAAIVIEGGELSGATGRTGTEAIVARASSVTSTHLGPGRNKLFIRGIADSSLVGPTQATVGQYWGNSRITYSAPDPSLRLHDIGSVEVLEGPQGTLYGAGSLGGVVRVIPKSPDLHARAGVAWGGAQVVEHGDMGVDSGVVVNVPIVAGELAFRGLAFSSVEGGYIDDRERELRNVNRVRTAGGRGALRWDAGDDLVIDFNVMGQRIRGDDGQYADRLGTGLDRASSIAQPFGNDFLLSDVVLRKRWGPLELSASLGYARQRVFERFEGPMLPDLTDPTRNPLAQAPVIAFTQDNRIRMFTHEVRLSNRGPAGTGWLIAGSALQNVAQVRRTMGFGSLAQPVFLTGVRNAVRELTVYGEYSFPLIRDLNLTLGGRFTHSNLSGRAQDAADTVALRRDPQAATGRHETRLLPSIGVAWRQSDRLTLFVRSQEGFRPGGIAVRQDYIQRFDGDRIVTADMGGRYSSPKFDSSMTLSWTHWRNIQADLVDSLGFPATANIGDGRVLSFGWSGRWRPVDGLEFDATIYLNDSRIVTLSKQVSVTVDETVATDRLPNVADASGRVGIKYSRTLANENRFDASVHARYIGQSSLGIGTILGRKQGDHVDSGVELRYGSDKRRVTLSVTNLLDSVGNRFALGSPFLIRNESQITPLQPRTVRLGFEFSF